MTWMDSVGFQILEKFEYRLPGDFSLSKMMNWTRREFPMEKLKKTPDSKCAWCNAIEVTDRRRKYCDELCRESAFHYCYPQMPGSKAARLILLQNSACALCGLDYSEDLLNRALKSYAHNMRNMQSVWAERRDHPKVTFYQMGYGSGDTWQVDHITPLFKGGRGIGFDNVQVVCKSCHILKSIDERRGPY